MDFYKQLSDEYEKRVTPLRAKIATLREQYAGVTASSVLEKEAAQRSVFARKIEEGLALDKTGMVESARADLHDLNEKTAKREKSILDISREVKQLEEEITRTGYRVLDELYPRITESTRTMMQATVDAIDQAYEDVSKFEALAHCREDTSKYREGLRFVPFGPTEKLRARLERWI